MMALLSLVIVVSLAPSSLLAETTGCGAQGCQAALADDTTLVQTKLGANSSLNRHELGAHAEKITWKIVKTCQPKTIDATVKSTLKKVLRKAVKIENSRADEKSTNGDHRANTAASVLSDFKSDDASGADSTQTITGTDKEDILAAIAEVVRSTSLEQAVKEDTVIDAGTLTALFGLSESAEEMNSQKDCVEGDMCPSTPDSKLSLLQAIKNGKRWAGKTWPQNKPIPYCYATDIAPSAQQAFEDSVQHYTSLIPCIAFKRVATVRGTSNDETPQQECDSPHAIFVQSQGGGAGCYANLGMSDMGGRKTTTVQLEPNGCDTLGVAAHELGHAIGMTHEQSRPDREKYVTVEFQNIKAGMENNFEKDADGDDAIPYDYRSLMHYGGDFFAVTGRDGQKTKTITRKDGQTGTGTLGNRMGLTRADADQVARMYGCHGSQIDFKLCSSRQDQCTSEECICHQLPKGEEPMIKFEKSSGCFQCVAQCMTPPPGSSGCTPGFCGCPQGMTKWTGQTDSGGSCHKCIDPNVPGPPCPIVPNMNTDATCSCKAPAERKTQEQNGNVFYGCSSEGGGNDGGDSPSGEGANAGGGSSRGGEAACPTYPGMTSRASCTCEAPVVQQTTEQDGQSWYFCNSACPTVPSYGGEESCFCDAPAEKKTLEQDGEVFYGCDSEGGGPTPSPPRGDYDYGGEPGDYDYGGEPAAMVGKKSQVLEQCHSTGNSCTLIESCICPSDAGLLKKKVTKHEDGGVCYVCRPRVPPPSSLLLAECLCPGEPGTCTDIAHCGCKEGFTRAKHSVGDGKHCYACKATADAAKANE